jgi:hypothetical protein
MTPDGIEPWTIYIYIEREREREREREQSEVILNI